MGLILSILGVVLLLFIAAWWRRQPPQEASRPAPGSSAAGSGTRFHAVSIKFEENACSAAKNMEGKRFLSSAAPRFPLPECDVLECKCRFIHHKDRRGSDDRRSGYRNTISGDTGKFEKEKRIRGERRGDDPNDFFPK